jgi:aerobic carbon-monoxide dehydrogenase medium subunit
MYPGLFEYEIPTTIRETLALLAANSEAKILAGGQSLLPLMKQRLINPRLLIDIAQVQDLIQLQEEDGTVTVGARLTHADSAVHEVLRKEVPLLARASSWAADRQVRRRGTVCGALVNADPTSDECCATLSLGGTMLAYSVDGVREISADHFFIDEHQSALEPHELLVAIRFPKRRSGEGWGYDKLGVRGGHSGWAVTGAAAWIRMDAGEISSARLAIAGAGRVTTLAQRAAQTLIGTNGSEAVLKEAARVASEEVDCVDDLNGSAAYKKQLIQVYVRRALMQAIANADM